MATIKDIARESGYGVSTVSYALKNDPKIPESTRQKIKDVASRLNYFPNASARSLKTRKSYSIGVFVPGFKGPIHPTILSGIAEVIKKVRNKYKMLVTFVDEDFLLVYQRQIDVAVIVGAHVQEEKAIAISNEIPLILVDNAINHPNIYNTKVDNYGGIKKRVVDFYNKGSKKFIFMRGSHFSVHNQERLEGFLAGIKTCNLDLDSQIILDGLAFTEKHGYECMKNYLKSNKLDADALICANDELAIGAIKAIKENDNCDVNNIRISGFDNIEKGEYVSPALSSISVDWYGYGKKIGNLILDILEQRKIKEEICMETTLFDRES